MTDEVILKDENGQEIQSNKRLILAIIAAIAGSLIGLAIWIGLAAVDFVASIAALAVTYFAKLFYDLAKGPQTKVKFWVILVITIVILLISEYLSLYVFLVVAKYPGVTFLNTLSIVFNNFGVFLFDLIMFVLFSLFGCCSSLIQIYREVTGKIKPKVKATNFNKKDNENFETTFKEFEDNSNDRFDDNLDDKFDDSAFDN